MEEIWKDVEGFEDKYEVSNLGRVRGKDRLVPCALAKNGLKQWKGKIIAPDILKDGYYKIGLHKGGKKHLMALHRVVAIAFVPGRTEENRIVNHIDCNPANNRADNLEWCTYSYNNSYAGAKERAWATRMKQGKYVNPPRSVEAWKDGVLVGVFPSLTEAAIFCRRTPTAVMYCCKGVTKKCGGYQWKYSIETGQQLGREHLELVAALR